jgi:hypothetical protein
VSIAIASLIGSGVALVAAGALSGLATLLSRWWRWRRSAGYRAAVMREPPGRQSSHPLGLDLYPWGAVRLAAVAVLSLMALATRPGLLALAPLGYLAPELVLRPYLERRARARLRLATRDLLNELRLLLAVGTSLGPALEAVSKGAVGERDLRKMPLRIALASEIGGDVYSRLPQQILADVAERLGSDDLREVVARLQAAQNGQDSYQSAIDGAAQELSERIAEQAAEAIEGAPTRLILPMLACMLLPVLILGFYPPLMRVVSAITSLPVR